MKQPLISVITICYNSEACIEGTIRSVLAQDYPHIDYVIIDGGSKDRTLDIVARYRDRLGYFVSEPDEGISDAFNKGIAAAKGDLIVMINSDDILLPGALTSVARAYDGCTDVYRGNVIVANADTDYRGREVPSMRFPLAPLTIRCAHQGTFITPDAYRRYGLYDKKFRYMMDYDLLTRFYQRGATFKYVDADIAEFRLGGVSGAWSYRKRYDIMHVVTNNGGSQLRAVWYYIYMVSFDLTKRLVIALFGINSLKRLHYGRLKGKQSAATPSEKA